jgi:hypothetical protein
MSMMKLALTLLPRPWLLLDRPASVWNCAHCSQPKQPAAQTSMGSERISTTRNEDAPNGAEVSHRKLKHHLTMTKMRQMKMKTTTKTMMTIVAKHRLNLSKMTLLVHQRLWIVANLIVSPAAVHRRHQSCVVDFALFLSRFARRFCPNSTGR